MQQPDLDQGQASIASLLRQATEGLRRAGIEEAAGDTRRLLSAVTGFSAARLLARPEHAVAADQARKFGELVERRRRREPVARILGEAEFYGRLFKLSPATLQPRSDTELLISVTLELVQRENWHERPLRILDMGTGSGCLLLTLLAELPQANGLGTDISSAALDIAVANAHRLGLGHRAAWEETDALDAITGMFDILISNPPYVRSGDIGALAPEVREHDPLNALDGGRDGLAFYRRLASRIPSVVPTGWAVLEIGFEQADAVTSILATMPGRFDSASVHRDIEDRPRCVAVRTRN
jgi:release factor glutamine methyltransferase